MLRRKASAFGNNAHTLQARRPRVTNQSSASAGIRLRKLLANELRGSCPGDLRATSCTSDWSQVQPGDLFIAIIGDDEDGHDFAAAAAERGAAGIVCERQLPVFGVPQV